MKEHSPESLVFAAASAVPRANTSAGTGVEAIGGEPETDKTTAVPVTAVAPVTRILGLTRDAAARDLLMEIALDRGYGLCCAVDGAEAILILGTEPPALMVVDIDTPDGRALIRALRANERWRGIPLLALTATNNPMVTVAVDAPVFFKPDLDGLLEAVTGRFEPKDPEPSEMARWPGRPPPSA